MAFAIYSQNPISALSIQEDFMTVLVRSDAHEIFSRIILDQEELPISAQIGKMAAKRLSPFLGDFTQEELVKIIRFFMASNCTHPPFFANALQAIEQHLESLNETEMFDLLAMSDELEKYQTQTPPNQLLVKFLQDMQSILYEKLQKDETLILALREGLNKGLYDASRSESLLKALLFLGKLKPKQLAAYRTLFESLKTKVLANTRLSPAYLTNFALFLSGVTPTKYAKKNFYSTSAYQTVAARLQYEVNSLSLKQRSDIVASDAKARIRNQSLLRTFARKLSHLKPAEIFENFALVSKNLESYAKLNYPNQNVFETVYHVIVLSGMSFPQGIALETLYATTLWGANPGTIPIKKVRQIYLSISPHVNPASCNDHMRYELIQRFSSILFPNPLLPPLDKKQQHAPTLGSVSQTQKKIAEFLTSEAEEVECETHIDAYPYPVDMILPQRKLVIEIDGPHHYDVSGTQRMGKESLKDFILINSGWHIEHVKLDKKSPNLQSLLQIVKSYPCLNK